MNLRCDHTFVQDDGWHTAFHRYEDFIRRHQNCKTLYLELGVGGKTLAIIKYPFWQMTAKNSNASYACINLEEAVCPREIEKQSICIGVDIGQVMDDLTGHAQHTNADGRKDSGRHFFRCSYEKVWDIKQWIRNTQKSLLGKTTSIKPLK